MQTVSDLDLTKAVVLVTILKIILKFNLICFLLLKNEDIIYQNIKHAFFQPAEKELITVVHFHLHDEIIINKKKV